MSFEYADKVEDFFVGGLQFIKGFFLTAFDIAFRPARFASKLGDRRAPYVRPFSFLTISTFSVITVARRLIGYLIVAWISFVSGCDPETNVPVKRMSLTEVPSLPSLDTIIYVALPVVLLVVIISYCSDAALLQRTQASAVRVTTIMPYVIGMQFIITPLFLAIGALVSFREDALPEVKNLAWVAGSAGLLWPAVVFYRICDRVRPALAYKILHPVVRRVSVAILGLLMLALSLTASVGIAFQLATKDTESTTVRPLLSVGIARVLEDEAGRKDRLTFSAVVRNNSDTDLWLLNQPLTYASAFTGQIIGTDPQHDLTYLPAGKETALMIRLTGKFADLNRDNETYVRFRSVDVKGKRQTISTQIADDEHDPLNEPPGSLNAIAFPPSTSPSELIVSHWRLRAHQLATKAAPLPLPVERKATNP